MKNKQEHRDNFRKEPQEEQARRHRVENEKLDYGAKYHVIILKHETGNIRPAKHPSSSRLQRIKHCFTLKEAFQTNKILFSLADFLNRISGDVIFRFFVVEC